MTLPQRRRPPPGEQLEELAEISSKYILMDPVGFLSAQALHEECFGAGFLGPDYVDQPQARREEYDRRSKALDSVTDPALQSVKLRCESTIDVRGDDGR